MDGVKYWDNNQNFEGGPGDRLSAESLPLIDTRLLSQSELRSLSQCSTFSSSSSASLADSAGGDDDLTPKIDRSVFNESAGSRKQTFLRLRLAREPPPPGPPPPQRQKVDSSREEKSQIASLLRSLFPVDSIPTKAEEDDGDEELEAKDSQPLISQPIHSNTNAYLNPYHDSVQNVLIQGISRNETRRRPGRPRKIQNPNDGGINEDTKVLNFSLTGDAFAYTADSAREGSMTVDKTSREFGIESRHESSGISMDSDSGKRKIDLSGKRGGGGREDKEETVNFENREGRMVDLSALANNAWDPYGDELRRITMGLETKEAFLGFLDQLNGEWVNAGKKKKVVEASDYGGYLPRGWKLMLCIKKKGSSHWLACHRYISPDGHEFATCKEVFTYLQPLIETQSKNQLNYLQFDSNKIREHPVMANEFLVGSSDSVDLSVVSPEANQNLESGRPSSEVIEEAKGDVPDPVRTSMVEKDDNPTAEFENGNNVHRDDKTEKSAQFGW